MTTEGIPGAADNNIVDPVGLRLGHSCGTRCHQHRLGEPAAPVAPIHDMGPKRAN
jgi:hypothetical protein